MAIAPLELIGAQLGPEFSLARVGRCPDSASLTAPAEPCGGEGTSIYLSPRAGSTLAPPSTSPLSF